MLKSLSFIKNRQRLQLKRLLGFTLAEVLIVLGIIGLVASMTIPALLNDIKDQEYKAAYKKAYSMASQAWLNAYSNGELTPCANWDDKSGGTCNADHFVAFKNEFRVMQDCGSDTASCWNMDGEKSWQDLGGTPGAGALSFIDASGMAWSRLSAVSAVEVLVDTNGNKPPNQYGKDRAVFTLLYGTASKINANYQSQPVVGLTLDCYNTSDVNSVERCPSLATHPCYYTSWITGAK